MTPTQSSYVVFVALILLVSYVLLCSSAGCDSLMPFLSKHRLAEDSSFCLTNGRSAFSDSLAEYALMAVLYFNKQLPRLVKNKEEKRWDKFQMDTVDKKTVAFIGFGHIAQQTARLLQKTFGSKLRMNILKRSNTSQSSSPADFADLNISQVFYSDQGGNDLAIYQDADYVICTLPGTAETLNFVGAEQFKAMKQEAVFISLGRGLVVDEDALAQALQQHQLKGAALDVFKTEPLPQDSPLWTSPNLCKLQSIVTLPSMFYFRLFI